MAIIQAQNTRCKTLTSTIHVHGFFYMHNNFVVSFSSVGSQFSDAQHSTQLLASSDFVSHLGLGIKFPCNCKNPKPKTQNTKHKHCQ
jgi:hypothetical protein